MLAIFLFFQKSSDLSICINHKYKQPYIYSVFLVDRIEKIPEEVLLPYFENTSEITTHQVLLTLYILAFHENIISFKTDQKLALTNHQEQQGIYINMLL